MIDMNNTATHTTQPAVVIRSARREDEIALARLAELDSARPLTGPVLVAEAGDKIVAALEVQTSRTIADPFLPTMDLVALLEVRAARLRGRPQRTARGPSILERTRHALAARP
jgi:hypothetical protein